MQRYVWVLGLFFVVWCGALPRAFSQEHPSNRRAVFADFNGDGFLDAFVAHNGANSVWFGTKGGAFRSSGQRLRGCASSGLALGDVNSDGFLDVVVACSETPSVIWMGSKRGLFQRARLALPSAHSVALGDLNEDAHLDMVLGHTATASVWLGRRSRALLTQHNTFPLHQPYGLHLVDLNRDGHLDLVTAQSRANNRVFLGRGDGAWLPKPVEMPYTQGEGASITFAVALGDLNGDGLLDLWAANFGQPSAVWLHNGRGGWVRTSQEIGSLYTTHVALGDLDLDGDVDAVTTSMQGGVRVWLNSGDGTFRSQALCMASLVSEYVGLVDLNMDDILDVWVVFEDGSCRVLWGEEGGGLRDSAQRLVCGGKGRKRR